MRCAIARRPYHQLIFATLETHGVALGVPRLKILVWQDDGNGSRFASLQTDLLIGAEGFQRTFLVGRATEIDLHRLSAVHATVFLTGTEISILSFFSFLVFTLPKAKVV